MTKPPVIPSAARDLHLPQEVQIPRRSAPRDDIQLTLGELAAPAYLPPTHVPSPSQREAIEAEPSPLLVLAGPGAGKTFCLIERIRYLVEQLGVPPERLCAFTFTNKAAGEIADRLGRSLGSHAARVKTGTIHAFCAE